MRWSVAAYAPPRSRAAKRLAFLAYLYERGLVNDFILHDEDGERVADPSIRARRVGPRSTREETGSCRP